MPTPSFARSLPAGLIAASLLLGACGGGDEESSGPVSLHYPGYGVAVNHAGIIAVANNASTIRFIGAGKSDSVVTGGTPVHVVFAPGDSIAYATLQSGNGLVRLRVKPSGEILSLPYGHPLYNLIVHPSGTAVYVTTATGWLFKSDPTTLVKLDSVQLASASNGLAFGPGATPLYVSTISAGYLYRIDPGTLDKVDSFFVGSGAQRIAVSPGGDSVYVANEDAGSIKVVRPSTGTVTEQGMTGTPYGIALSHDGTKLYVALRESGMLKTLDRATLSVVDGVYLGGTPRNVAVDPDGEFIVVSTQEDVVKIR